MPSTRERRAYKITNAGVPHRSRWRSFGVTVIGTEIVCWLRDDMELRRVTGVSALLRRELNNTGVRGPDCRRCHAQWVLRQRRQRTGLLVDRRRRYCTPPPAGVATLLPRSEVVLIQVEGKLTWQGQWRSVDVSEFFLGTSFAPLSRNAEYNQQYTIIFVREDV